MSHARQLPHARVASLALAEFARAAEIDPGNARYAYVYGVALNSRGRTDEALEVLEATHARHPADRDTLLALITINRDAGRLGLGRPAGSPRPAGAPRCATRSREWPPVANEEWRRHVYPRAGKDGSDRRPTARRATS